MPHAKLDNSVYVRNLPPDLVKAFKSMCAEKGITMRQMVMLMMKRAIRKHKKEDLHE